MPAPTDLEHLDLGERPHEPFDLIGLILALPNGAAHDRDAEGGALPTFLVVDLGNRHAEAMAGTVDDGTQRGTPLFQRPAVR